MDLFSISDFISNDRHRIAVFCQRFQDGNRHTGLLIKSLEGEAYALHLANHHDFRYQSVSTIGGGVYTTFAYFEPENDPDSVSYLTTYLYAENVYLAAQANPIEYAFLYDGSSSFDRNNAVLTHTGKTLGLTCATFVLAFCADCCGIVIAAIDSWPSRGDDEVWQNQVIAYLLGSGRVNGEYANKLKQEVGCVRFRPEEITAASSYEPYEAPFNYCEPNGQVILDYLSRN